MHHLIGELVLYIVLPLLVIATGYFVAARLVDAIPTAKLGRMVALWLALFLLWPAVVEMPLDSYMAGHPVGYLSELGHEWSTYTMFLTGLAVSWIRRRRKRGQ